MYKWEESTPFCLRLESRVDEAGGMEGDQFVTVGTMMSSYKLLKLKKTICLLSISIWALVLVEPPTFQETGGTGKFKKPALSV